jgi:hypothetical protein
LPVDEPGIAAETLSASAIRLTWEYLSIAEQVRYYLSSAHCSLTNHSYELFVIQPLRHLLIGGCPDPVEDSSR